ncbi:MAG: hypothetical protein U5K69_08300 [Balneolaceae bacterium]|nr:hypothetical protein [Balneolaceae bacterium]
MAALPVMAQQSTYRAESIVRIDSQDTLSNNVILTGRTVEIMGYLNNDLFSASRHFLLNGRVNDDAIVTGQMVSIYGHIGDMLMTAGETVVIDGTIDGDLFAAGREVRVTSRAQIGGNAFVAGGTVSLEGGQIGGMLRVAGGEIMLNGSVNNSVEIYSNDVTFGENYQSTYSTTIHSSEPIHRESLGAIPGDLIIDTKEPDLIGIILFQFWFFLSVLITGLILIRLFQKTAIDMSKFATEGFWRNTGLGLLTIIAMPIAILLLAILILTIPLSILLVLTFVLALFAGYILVAITLGVMSILLFTDTAEPSSYYWGLGLGMIYVAILTNLPFIGGILNVILLLFGLGSLVHYIWRMRQSAPS